MTSAAARDSPPKEMPKWLKYTHDVLKECQHMALLASKGGGACQNIVLLGGNG